MLHGTPGPGAYKVPVLPVAVARRPLTQKASEGATRMYDAVNTTSPKDARKGQTYDVLDRGKVNGKSKLNVHAASYRMTKIGYAFCFTWKYTQSNHLLHITHNIIVHNNMIC